ncbi:hypothetical protein PG997_000407 [Apiospora hydei]|uniref:DUF7580 domain-containing protein n=1 Tax=Apiospora hydei TaxID=1337664 RepID=A0ABR1XAW6_9PEZI
MAEIVLGVLPLCLSAIKGSIAVLRTLKAVRNRKSEVERLKKEFETQRIIFLDECEILFQECLDDDVLAGELVKDTTHPAWQKSQLDKQIKTYLGRRLGRYEETIKDIQKYIKELSESLHGTAGDSQRPDVKVCLWKLRKPLQRLIGIFQLKKSEVTREELNVIRNKSKYESLIENLRKSNHELKNIREMASRRNESAPPPSHQAEPLVSLPSSYHTVAQYSASFYRALSETWSCKKPKHTNHEARLFLDCKNDTSFRVVLRCRTSSTQLANDTWVESMVLSESHELVKIPTPLGFQTDEKWPRAVEVRRLRDKDRRSTQQTGVSGTSKSSLLTAPVPINLGLSRDLCAQLCTQTKSAMCSRYLDASDHIRHSIRPFCDEKCDHKWCLDQDSLSDPTQLDSILDVTVEQSGLGVVQQLQLALRLVKGILQFASTPWLQALWHLKDLSYFQMKNGLSTALATVHINSDLTQQNHPRPKSINLHDTLLMALREHGIDNLTLFSLGMALLQIGCWRRLPIDDIGEVRRIAECNLGLGLAYQQITLQCLECNFASSKDLSNPKLQNAIYQHVVCKLEESINVLGGDCDVSY